MGVDVPDGELQVSRYNTVLFVVSCGITSEFKDLSSEIFEDSGEIYCVMSDTEI
jgi:hypothetical protein